jgi:dynein heavy chain 1, cytosolic
MQVSFGVNFHCRIQILSAPTASSTAAAVTFITFVQDLNRKTKAWGPLIELCTSGEKTLERFRYQFPEDWLYIDQLKGEWSAYNEILKRKNDSIQEQLGTEFRL